MTWKTSKLEVDLLPVMTEKMPPTNKKFSCCTPANKDALLKAILVVVVTGLIIQAAQTYLTAPTIASKHQQQEDIGSIEAPTLDLLPQASTETFKLVIYSYDGLKDLPLGDLMADTLTAHPQALYISQPNSHTYSPAFPTYKQKVVKQEMDHLLSCNHRLLTKADDAGYIKHSSCHGGPECDQRAHTLDRCLQASLRAVEMFHGSITDLQHLFQPNETLHFVHIAMDPRLYTTNKWTQQRDKESRSSPQHEDKSVLEEIAQNYCNNLMKDRKAIQKQRNATNSGSSTSTSQRYLFLRHEDLMLNPFGVMRDLFNFFELHMTEEILEGLQSVKGVELNDLYADVHSRVIDIVQQHCSKSIEKLGYPSKSDIEEGNVKLKPYKEWWKEAY